jgi:hypothetical protein
MPKDLTEYKVDELKAKAKKKGLSGYSKLRKDQLISLLRGEIVSSPKSRKSRRKSRKSTKGRRKSTKRGVRSVWDEDKGKMVAVRRKSRSPAKGKYYKWSKEKGKMVRSKRPVHKKERVARKSVRKSRRRTSRRRTSRRRTSRRASPSVRAVPVRWEGTHLVFDKKGRSRVHRRGKGVHTRL